MSAHTSVRQLALVSAVVGAVFATSASAQLFTSGTGSVRSFPNAIKFLGKLECELPDLGIYIDLDLDSPSNLRSPRLILTDKSATIDPNNPPEIAPATRAVCQESQDGVVVATGEGWFQQLAKSGRINAGGGQGPNPTGLVLDPPDGTPNTDGTRTYTLLFKVDDRASTDEQARYQITFTDPETNQLCNDGNNGYFNPCIHKMGLPNPTIAGESEVTKGSITFCQSSATCPTAVPFAQYVMEQMSVTLNVATQALIASTEFQARWLHNGTENGADVILDAVKIQGKPQTLRTSVETALDILVEFQVSPVVTSNTGVKSIHVLSSAQFDAPTAINLAGAKTIEINGQTVTCRSVSTVDINGDGRNDWRCGAETTDIVDAANLANCTTGSATAAFAVRAVTEGKLRWARDPDSTFPVNCN